MYEIESGVPIPVSAVPLAKYPLHKMKAGDMFRFPIGDKKNVTSTSAYRNRIFKKRGETLRFITRRIDETTAGCWLVDTKED